MKKTLIVSLLCLAVALPASAALPGDLGARQALSPSTHLSYLPAVAMDDAGNATAFWSYSSSSRHAMRFADRAVGEGFAPAYSKPTPESNLVAYPAIDMSPNGTTAVAWVDEVEGVAALLARYRPAGGEWGDFQVVSLGASDQDAYAEPDVAVSDSGRAVVMYLHYLEDGSHNYEAALSDTSGEFGTAQVIDNRMGTQSVSNFGPQAGIDALGNAMILWEAYDDAETDPRTFVMYATASSIAATFATPVQLIEVHQDGVDPRLAVNPTGQAVAIWRQTQEADEEFLNSATGTTLTGLSGVAPVPGGRPDWIDLALDEDGNAIVARRGLVDGDLFAEVIQANVRPAGGSWSAAQILDTNEDTETSLETSDVTLDVAAANGTGIVAWAREDPLDYMPARIAVLDATTDQFGEATLVTGIDAEVDHLRVDMNPQGDAVIVWRDDYRIYSMGTWEPPAVGNLTVSVNPRKAIAVSGSLTPPSPGATVSVTLQRKRSGVFRNIASKNATLNASGEYSTSFQAPRPGTCRVKARFAGDGLVRADTAQRTFDC